MERSYTILLDDHLQKERQMAFIAGPRQVGKTTLAQGLLGKQGIYLNWDQPKDRKRILQGADELADELGLFNVAPDGKDIRVVLDELHKFSRWKNFLKGFFDGYGSRAHIMVTGSARLNVYQRGGDSLMGRYFLYRLHPLSVAELQHRALLTGEYSDPHRTDPDKLDALFRFGGFPEPFLNGSERFYNRWRKLRTEQLLREELRDLTRVQELDQLEVLSHLLTAQSGQLANYSSLATQVCVSIDTIRRWLTLLESIFFCFRIRPWFRNVAKSLRKQPKVYLWDWSLVEPSGARIEALMASHLLKAVHWWTDTGLGTYDLHYLRDKNQREVDFLVSKNQIPWMIIEVKSSAQEPISPSLRYFADMLKVPYAFQAVWNMDYIDADCFANPGKGPLRVPAQTLLSQLI